MRYGRLIVLLVLVLAVAAPVVAGSKGHKCTASTQECLDKMVQSLKERGWVGIEMDEDENSGALTVTRVIEDSPAEKAGLRKGDVLLALNGIRFSDADEAAHKKMKASMKPGEKITYMVDRDGKKKDVSITLAPLPDAVVAEWVGRHMLEHASVEMAKK